MLGGRWDGRRVLVTGGAGFIGSAVVSRLVAAGVRVRVLDDMSRGRPRRLDAIAADVELISGDIRDQASVELACRDVDAVFHLAYINGTRNFYERPELVLDVAIRGMLSVIDGCRANGIRELILMSSSEVYQTPPVVPTDENTPLIVPDLLNPRYSYGGGKIACELMAINYGRRGFDRVVIVRPHNVYGRDMGYEHVIPEIALRLRSLPPSSERHPFPIQGSGRETRAFIHIDDFVDGFLLAADRGSHLDVFHVGNSEEVEISHVVELMADILGRRIELIPGPLSRGSTQRRCPDITRIQNLGFIPKIALAAGLPDVVRWYDRHPDDRSANDLLSANPANAS